MVQLRFEEIPNLLNLKGKEALPVWETEDFRSVNFQCYCVAAAMDSCVSR